MAAAKANFKLIEDFTLKTESKVANVADAKKKKETEVHSEAESFISYEQERETC